MVDRSIVLEWVKKAEDDFQFVKNHLPHEETFFAILCFHCQQAVEKYLKAVIVSLGRPFRKVHDLEELLSVCIGIDSSFESLRDETIKLQRYYVETRYPTVWPMGTEKRDADEALDAAQTVRDQVFSSLHIQDSELT
ncbi:HEPN domain-containing protein [Candidatus Gottesmanbacteria bacterium]|nr:HEPN domain-containing protein [Candidatus Gottesmanbacteria bacterium]